MSARRIDLVNGFSPVEVSVAAGLGKKAGRIALNTNKETSNPLGGLASLYLHHSAQIAFERLCSRIGIEMLGPIEEIGAGLSPAVVQGGGFRSPPGVFGIDHIATNAIK